ncbi:hypothetical protein XELAEV_18034519mg [Xenopus laevis]|uniref:Taste receptor type 2 n=1 Tax=Xenopus laevis TaxID=8355 RepID=A0A974CE55_XENLA|nr:hypothetical protein XELAEV_18034519mg [Xenopus laevis]
MTTLNQSISVNSYQVVSLGIAMTQTLIGSLANGFMFSINLMDFASQRSLGSGDSLLLCLGLSRFILQWILFTINLLSFWFTDLAVLYIPKIVFSFLFFSNTSLWFATFLCSFYCIKRNLTAGFLFFLLVSFAMSVIFSLPPVYVTFHRTGNWSIVKSSSPFLFVRANIPSFLTVSFLGSVLPFLIFCRVAILVVVFLWKHVLKMKRQERTGFKEPSMQPYYSAVKALGYFFLFYSFYIVSFNLFISGIATLNNWIGCFCTMLIGSYSSWHSVVLVLQNTKLQKALQKIRYYCCPVNQTVTDPT